MWRSNKTSSWVMLWHRAMVWLASIPHGLSVRCACGAALSRSGNCLKVSMPLQVIETESVAAAKAKL